MRSALAFALVLATVVPAHSQTTPDPRARCQQLIAYYDRFGVGRSLNSDGRRNHTRIGAEIDCRNGDYAKGIATMEQLLRAKKFSLPPVGPDEPEDDD